MTTETQEHTAQEAKAKETLQKITQSIKADIQYQNKAELDTLKQALADSEKNNKALQQEKQDIIINKEIVAIAMANGLHPQAGSSVENAVKGKFKLNEQGKVVSADSNYLNTPESFVKQLKIDSAYMFQGQQSNGSVIPLNEQLANAASAGDYEEYKRLRLKQAGS